MTAGQAWLMRMAQSNPSLAEILLPDILGVPKYIDIIENIYLKCVLEPKLTTTDQNTFIILKNHNFLTNKARNASFVPF